MDTPDPKFVEPAFVNAALEAAIRIGLVFLLVAWCFAIFRPFIEPVVWGIIIAVAIHPLYLKLVVLLGNRRRSAASVFTILALALLITPTVMLTVSLIDTAQVVSSGLDAGTIRVPPPPDSVAEWPLVGERLHSFWTLASRNLEAALERATPQLEAMATWLLSTFAVAGLEVLKFLFAIIVAGLLLANAERGHQMAEAISLRLSTKHGSEFADMAGATVRSVAQGVLGIALIQGILAGVGLLAIGVPAAGVWAFVILLLAVVQLPPLLILGPIIVYVFSTADTVPAVLFTVWSLLVSASDTVLKPLFLGRGVDVPMLVILVGAIGGMIFSGIIGLFIGAVVLALGYKLFTAWLIRDTASTEASAQHPGDG
jgi:predicted PurR-regulated permease PerM